MCAITDTELSASLLPFWFSSRVVGGLNFIFFDLWVFTFWPENSSSSISILPFNTTTTLTIALIQLKHTTPRGAGRQCVSEHCQGHTQTRRQLSGSTLRVLCQILSWRRPWDAILGLCVASPAKCLHHKSNRMKKVRIWSLLQQATTTFNRVSLPSCST